MKSVVTIVTAVLLGLAAGASADNRDDGACNGADANCGHRRFHKQSTQRPVIIVVATAWPVTARPAPSLGPSYGTEWRGIVHAVAQSRATLFGLYARETTENDQVIVASAEATGGDIQFVSSVSAVPVALDRTVAQLLGQYAITYNAAPAPKGGAKLRVLVQRPGVTVRAPERVGLK